MPFKVCVDAQLDNLIEPIRAGPSAQVVEHMITTHLSVLSDGKWLIMDTGKSGNGDELPT